MDSPGNRADDGQLNPTAAEVADMRERWKKVKTVDYAAWAATILSVVLGYFFFHWTYFWVIPIICFVCSVGARHVYNLSYFEEEYLMFERKDEKRLRRASD
ncbi:hypothetical protein ACUY3N_09690 [Corynebacterium tuberculostearicum]